IAQALMEVKNDTDVLLIGVPAELATDDDMEETVLVVVFFEILDVVVGHVFIEFAADGQSQELLTGIDVGAEDSIRLEGVAEKFNLAHAGHRAFGDVEDNAAVAGLIALDQLHAGPHPAFLLIFSDDGLAGALIRT